MERGLRPLFPGFVIDTSFPGVYGNCPNQSPSTAGPDYDFAQGPMLLDGGLVGAGEKSGIFWAFHRKNGALAWKTQAAPGGITGGLQWGSATDGDRIFVAASNSGTAQKGGGTGAVPWKLKDGTTVISGGWAALDRKTGDVLWTTKDPDGSRSEAPGQRDKRCRVRLQPAFRRRTDGGNGRQDRRHTLVVQQRRHVQCRCIDLATAWSFGETALLPAPEQRRCSRSGCLPAPAMMMMTIIDEN